MPVFRARWVVPVTSPPLRDGWLSVRDGRVVAVGSGAASAPESERRGTAAGRSVDLGPVAVLPALTNAHTHLELSWLRGKVPAAVSLVDWVRSLMSQRLARGVDDAEAISGAVAEARRSGTGLVGDIGNTLLSVGPLCESPLHAVVFKEVLGFSDAAAGEIVTRALEDVRSVRACEHVAVRLAPHALYSTSAALFRAVGEWRRVHDVVTSVHVAESAAELELLASGAGEWRGFLESLGVWTADWTVPACTPVEYLDRLGFLNGRTLVVHGVHLSDADLARIAERGATLVTCPRSNVRVGSGDPPVARFYRSGVRVAVGTDSLASVDDLNVFNELAAMRRLAPDVPARALLESATFIGAQALGFADRGTIESEASADLIVVDVPPGVGDVEEYLVSGITPDRIHWLSEVGTGAEPGEA